MQKAVSQSRAADITASEDTSVDTRAIPPFTGLEGRGYRARKPGNNHGHNGPWGKNGFALCIVSNACPGAHTRAQITSN